MNKRRMGAVVTAVLLAASAGIAGCSQTERVPPRQAQHGDPDRGATLIAQYGCGSCHTIPGIATANGLVGPPLDHFSRRGYIAGMLPNSEKNLQYWIRQPQKVVPGNDMPDLGVTKQDAADITAYLYTLK